MQIKQHFGPGSDKAGKHCVSQPAKSHCRGKGNKGHRKTYSEKKWNRKRDRGIRIALTK